MLNIGSIKLRRWRQAGGQSPEPGQARALTQEEVGRIVGASSMFISMIERGDRTPGLKLAAKLQELGVCAPEDWTRPATCIACGIALGHGAPDCAKRDCEWQEVDADASARAAA